MCKRVLKQKAKLSPQDIQAPVNHGVAEKKGGFVNQNSKRQVQSLSTSSFFFPLLSSFSCFKGCEPASAQQRQMVVLVTTGTFLFPASFSVPIG